MERARKIKIIFALIMIITGLGIFSYPFISNFLANRNATVAVNDYVANVDNMKKEEIDALKAAAEAFNNQINSVNDKNEKGEGEEYNSYIDLIQLGDAIGYITIPKLDLNLPIYEGTGADVLSHGIGHLKETSYPLGGPGTHTALSGHRGMAAAELFTNLDKLEMGDMFYLHILDEILAYQVDQIVVVLPTDTEPLGIVDGEDLCTLVTCTPIGINSHRLLVRGKRAEYSGEEIASSDAIYQGVHIGTAVKRLIDIWPWLTLAAIISIGFEMFMMLMLLKAIRTSKEDD